MIRAAPLEARLSQSARKGRNHEVQDLYVPKILCGNCPGKRYDVGPLLTVDNFETHLRNRRHRARVRDRLEDLAGVTTEMFGETRRAADREENWSSTDTV